MNKQFDQKLIDKLIKVLGDAGPYYLQKAYTDSKLREEIEGNDRLSKLEAKIGTLENNHLHDIDDAIKKLGEDIYDMGAIVEQLREKTDA